MIERIVRAGAERAPAAAHEHRIAVRTAERAAGVLRRIHAARLVRLQVGNGQVDRAVHILRADAVRVVVAEPAALVAETVRAAEREAAIVCTAELHRVVHPRVVGEVVVVVRVIGEVAAESRARRRQRRDEVHQEIVLPAERHRAPLAAREADPGLTAELVAAVAELAVRDVEAVLEGEHGGQTAAEILVAAQPPARRADVAALHAVSGPRAGRRFLVADVVQARVDRAVQRDAALRMRRACKQARNRCRDCQKFLHDGFARVDRSSRIAGRCGTADPSAMRWRTI
ncbi:Uncharacterised protein [Burkholderia cepacia]|uniref:Uncharacterized protein n=1 Tax=Burkholderia cepacia TaxID=292 RepID=A0AAE8NKM0_BURCE|nr:Uncharacterised protein [Burkholderia cepacia]